MHYQLPSSPSLRELLLESAEGLVVLSVLPLLPLELELAPVRCGIVSGIH